MDLLMEWVEQDTTRLVGRWRRNTVPWYFHILSIFFTDNLAVHIFQYGYYTLNLPVHAAV